MIIAQVCWLWCAVGFLPAVMVLIAALIWWRNRSGRGVQPQEPVARREDPQNVQELLKRAEDQLKDAIAEELGDVKRRRNLEFDAAAANEEAGRNLVGLALSGGGIRSAMFNLGLVQALHESGLYRYLDYLSTVSGGSYLGVQLASRVLKVQHDRPSGQPRRPREEFPLRPEPNGKQLDRVRRFIRHGNYLDRPWGFFFDYSWRLALNLLLVGSSLFFVCALLACAWRALGAWCRTVTSDLTSTFLPILLLGAFCLWALRRRDNRLAREGYNYDRPAVRKAVRLVQLCDLLFAIFVVVSFTVLFSNDTVSLGHVGRLVPSSWLIYDARTHAQASLDLDALSGALRVLLYSVIAVLVVPALVLRIRPAVRPGVSPLERGPQQAFGGQIVRLLLFGLLAAPVVAVLFVLARENISGRAPHGKIVKVDAYWSDATNAPKLRSVHLFSREQLELYMGESLADVLPQERALILQKLLGRDDRAVTSAQVAALEVRFDEGFSKEQAFHSRIILQQRFDDSNTEAERGNGFELALQWYDTRNNTLWLGRESGEVLPDHLERFALYIRVAENKESAYGRLNIVAVNRPDSAQSAAPTVAPENPPGRWSRSVSVRPSTVAEEDQTIRLTVLSTSFFIFLGLATIVNLNHSSMHGFYRDRLREAYVESLPNRGRYIRLSELDNASEGAPYPLFSGTLHLRGDHLFADNRWLFLFSPRVCGSEVTGYVQTRTYLGHRDDLAEIAALSGAAVSPIEAKGPLAVLLALANMRLGQWLPTPGKARPKWFKSYDWPTLFRVVTDYIFREAEFRYWCLVTDGGHSENLGLWPLLQRRCKLIFVSDASEDPAHAFDDFLKVCRRIRLYHGVEIRSLFRDQPLALQPLQLQPDVFCKGHFFVGRIRYPADFMWIGPGAPIEEEGFIVYVKPSLTSDEDNDLLRHFRHRRPFPHDPTVNQLFDEDTVESYRQLGFHIGAALGSKLPLDLWEKGRYPVEELVRNFLI